MNLGLLDWSIIVGFLAVSLFIGLFFSKRAGSSISEYFVSGRSLPWWIAGTSMVATTFAADTPLAVTSLVVKYGVAGNWFWWAFAFGGMITVFVYSRLWRRSEVMTDVELIGLRYSGTSAKVLRVSRAVYVALIVNPIIIGWVVKAIMTVMSETVLFDRDLGVGAQTGILIGLLIAVGLYCMLSGMWGVAFTDVLQFIIAMGGCIWLAYIVIQAAGGTDALQEKVVQNFGSDEAFRFIPSFSMQDPWMPLYIFMILLLVNWWATWFPGAEPGGGGYVVQRMAACRSEKDSMFATLWYQVAHYCLRPWPWLIVAFAVLAFYPELRQSYIDGEPGDPGVGFPRIIREYCGDWPGAQGLLLVAFFAAFMSTISTQMNWGASYLMRDVVQVIWPNIPEKSLTFYSRILSLVVLAEGGIVGYLFWQKGLSVDAAWKYLAALGAGTGLVFMLRWFWWRINAWTEISAMFAALIYFSILQALKLFVIPADTDLILFQKEEVLMATVAFLTIATWLVVTYMTRPEDDKTLVSFFEKIRPAGPGWKPIAEKAPAVQTDNQLGLSILAAFVGAALIYSLLPFVGAVIFGDSRTMAISGSVAFLSAIGLYFLVNRLAKDDPEK